MFYVLNVVWINIFALHCCGEFIFAFHINSTYLKFFLKKKSEGVSSGGFRRFSGYIDLIRLTRVEGEGNVYLHRPNSQWVSLNFTTWHMLICCDGKIPMADLFVICWLNFTTIFMIMTSIKHHLHPAESRFESFFPISKKKNFRAEKNSITRNIFAIASLKLKGQDLNFLSPSTTTDMRKNMNPFLWWGCFSITTLSERWRQVFSSLSAFVENRLMLFLSIHNLNEILMQKEH